MRQNLPALGSDPEPGQAPADTGLATDGLAASRRRIAADGVGIVASIIGFGLAFGLSARLGGHSLIEAAAMSSILFAGASRSSPRWAPWPVGPAGRPSSSWPAS